ncbi:putative toxin-antitoxin system toxin component, PIN family [Lysobacter cavernae]|uniref:Toxin-antitoxin system toxin component, PIN family n=1 Tax=Lysobacter cavernae TaxID=1685901 RepID=A0ABV7RN56_9GAMM
MTSACAAAFDAGQAPRVVLDTNACLDLFVFRDPRVAALLTALQTGDVIAVTDRDCREEWLRVLAYPQLQLYQAAQTAAREAFDALVHCLQDVAPEPASCPLPRCADPDDQKFLELALASGARWLLSRDDALLRLGRRTQRAGLFEILHPRSWAALRELRD